MFGPLTSSTRPGAVELEVERHDSPARASPIASSGWRAARSASRSPPGSTAIAPNSTAQRARACRLSSWTSAVLERLELRRRLPHRRRQLEQDAALLLPDPGAQLDHLVVGLAQLERLDEQRLPAARDVVHDAAPPREAGRRHQRHEALAVPGHVGRLAETVRPALEALLEPALALLEPAPQAGELGRGAVRHAPVRLERGGQPAAQRLHVGQRVHEAPPARGSAHARLVGPQRARLARRLEPAQHLDQARPVEGLARLGASRGARSPAPTRHQGPGSRWRRIAASSSARSHARAPRRRPAGRHASRRERAPLPAARAATAAVTRSYSRSRRE